jgi:hypothetical protein
MFLGGLVSICRERRNGRPSRAWPRGGGAALVSHHGRKRPRTVSGLREKVRGAGEYLRLASSGARIRACVRAAAGGGRVPARCSLPLPASSATAAGVDALGGPVWCGLGDVAIASSLAGASGVVIAAASRAPNSASAAQSGHVRVRRGHAPVKGRDVRVLVPGRAEGEAIREGVLLAETVRRPCRWWNRQRLLWRMTKGRREATMNLELGPLTRRVSALATLACATRPSIPRVPFHYISGSHSLDGHMTHTQYFDFLLFVTNRDLFG